MADWGRIGKGVATWGVSELVPELSGSREMRRAQEEAARKQEAERYRRRQTQLNLLGTMHKPQISPEMERRLAALEDESKPRALVEDPLFQGQRAQLLGGAQQLQSGIENEQLGRSVRGGFANIGSTQDVQDRLGVALADLAGQAQATREKKRDLAAISRQQMVDAQQEFENARIQAQMAIESGDSDMALAAINQAYQARNAAAQAERQMYASIIGAVGAVGGAMVGGAPGAAVGSQAGNVATGQPIGGAKQNQYSTGADVDFGQPQNFDTGARYSRSDMPYRSRRYA